MRITMNTRSRAEFSLTAEDLQTIKDALETAGILHIQAHKLAGQTYSEAMATDRFTSLACDFEEALGICSLVSKSYCKDLPETATLSFKPPKGSIYDADKGSWLFEGRLGSHSEQG